MFISYSRRDGDWVRELAAALTEVNVMTWIDLDDIPISAKWLDEITRAVQECSVFVACESAAFRASGPCGAEGELATRFGRPVCRVLVGDDVGATVRRIVNARAGVRPSQLVATELTVRARDWDAAGQRRKGLASGPARRRMERADRAERFRRNASGISDDMSPEVTAYLRASRRRTRGRATIAGLTTLLTGVAVLVTTVIVGTQQRVDQTNERQARAYRSYVDQKTEGDADPYLALRNAAAVTSTDVDLDADIVHQGADQHVPDDAFRVPGGAVRFAARPVGARVVVADRHGTLWARGSGDRETRTASRVPG
ncbi:MAG: toll/interleukin-1 receptor domain-containing protein, partial [Actinocatenispora sp.]